MNKSPSQNNKLKLNCDNDEQFASSKLCLIHIYINKKILMGVCVMYVLACVLAMMAYTHAHECYRP